VECSGSDKCNEENYILMRKPDASSTKLTRLNYVKFIGTIIGGGHSVAAHQTPWSLLYLKYI